MIIGPIRSG